MFSRRDFVRSGLQASTLIALSPTVPAFLTRTARAAEPKTGARILVVIQLDGGNDGINTLVRFKDEGYARYRKVLRLPTADLIRVNDEVGLHPSLAAADKLLDAGRLAIIQGVGYPNPNRSHFESMAVWHTARPDRAERTGVGWLGAAFDGATLDDAAGGEGGPAALFVGGGSMPDAIRGRRAAASALVRPDDLVLSESVRARPVVPAHAPQDDLAAFVRRSALDAYATSTRMAELAGDRGNDGSYPPFRLADRLRLVARLIKSETGARVFYLTQPGYDTHAGQLPNQAILLREWAESLQAFLDDLAAAGLAERVAVLSFSEFGRTVKENGSAGTDHGTAGMAFLAASRVETELVGTTPNLLDLDMVHGDLKMGIDFRRIYATVLDDWLNLPSQGVLGAAYERLRLFPS